MSDSTHHHDPHPVEHHGSVSHDSIVAEPWLTTWWPVLVIGYAFLLAMFLLLITNQTYGR